ncbi:MULTISPECIES: adenosylmethionine decarboxylase [Bombella]|uniref:S-adenosylmethionine decarboxylase proenzyme n=2 Tax=Bombella TaxID=1654741 RepID=A0ABT3WMT8_9PROT|nr:MULTISPECIES: adenosylmethionine decarboxylase [Bombella]PHI96856.1 S-adenosylmethionine decarboxylase proenzyme [Parasaccharibacter apium]MCX5614496.1 adenosylmethionine decarboxylase [Bombella saccharophila]MCX5619154.1 adenosylmethionine decarboxylase [Bombella pollinis]MUG05514.1 adenosylmethionine decarboxylase [Bombella sp. ESL0378]MUG89323.1 adenosylmethionine decarboxylase [Bombella sp. ESL0385]
MDALARLGMESDLPRDIQNTEAIHAVEDCKDFFIKQGGETYAGNHLLVDFWNARNLDDPEQIDATLRRAAKAAGATILHGHFHHFTPNGGVSGVIVLAESHISIHTWPERHFAAVDIFMCGVCDPNRSVPVMQELFQAGRVEIDAFKRGRVSATRHTGR